MNQGQEREREYVGVNGNGAELRGGIYELSRRGERGVGKRGGQATILRQNCISEE